jgi:hypothetical protein
MEFGKWRTEGGKMIWRQRDSLGFGNRFIWNKLGNCGCFHALPTSRRNKRLQSLRRGLRIEPDGTILIAQDRRHALVNGSHEFVRRAGNHRHGIPRAKPGKTKGLIIGVVNERCLLVGPLVKAVDGYKAWLCGNMLMNVTSMKIPWLQRVIGEQATEVAQPRHDDVLDF